MHFHDPEGCRDVIMACRIVGIPNAITDGKQRCSIDLKSMLVRSGTCIRLSPARRW